MSGSQQYDDGWLSRSEAESDQGEKQPLHANYRNDHGLSILTSKNHSLEPDMLHGWRPKLPSCPLPLSYPNIYLDSLMKILPLDDRFSVAYASQKLVNSVQVNQQYTYNWKYRERYSLNLALIQQAVNSIGKDGRDNGIKINPKAQYGFDSSFESGNLQLAVRVKKNEYDCFMRSDTNTKGHTNWYYFKVNNKEQIGEVKINICNFSRTKNLYSKGMKPYVLQNQKGQWSQQPCYQVSFVERLCRYGLDIKTHQLQFKYNFKQKNKSIYLAYAVPYTYSRLERYIKNITEQYPAHVKCRKLCESLGGIDLPLLVITNHPQDGQENINNNKIQDEHQNKKAILLTARIHPGQSNASHMMEGFIQKIIQNTVQAEQLRNLFVFYVVPMLNPDGVIIGNFRTSYSGKDLNRQFNKLNKYFFPQITALNDLAMELKSIHTKGVSFYMDFHGHSVKKGLFCYGPEHPPSKSYYLKSRAMAKLIEQLNPMFSYGSSIFTINQTKKYTGRAHMLRTVKIPMTFTFEISNGIFEGKDKVLKLYDRQLLLEGGHAIFNGFYRYIQLEMRLPRKTIKPPGNNTTNIPKRVIHSSKSIRQGKSSREKVEIKKEREKEVYNFVPNERLRSRKSVSNNQVKVYSDFSKPNDDPRNLLDIFKEITDQIIEEQVQNLQGGSDSEGSQQDLTKEETNNLFKQIMISNDTKHGYKQRDWKPKDQARVSMRKKQNQKKQEQKQIPRNPNRLEELSKPTLYLLNNRNLKKGGSIQYEKKVVVQKHFTMNL